MKISEVQIRLSQILQTHGDIPVAFEDREFLGDFFTVKEVTVMRKKSCSSRLIDDDSEDLGEMFVALTSM